MNAPLEEVDPEVADIIELEKARQWKVVHFFLFSVYLCQIRSSFLSDSLVSFHLDAYLEDVFGFDY